MYLPTKTSLLKLMYFSSLLGIHLIFPSLLPRFLLNKCVIIGQILEYNWSKLWLFEFEVAFSMGSAAILSRVMTVVSDFVMITSLIIIK